MPDKDSVSAGRGQDFGIFELPKARVRFPRKKKPGMRLLAAGPITCGGGAENRTPVHTIFSPRLYKLIPWSGSRPPQSTDKR